MALAFANAISSSRPIVKKAIAHDLFTSGPVDVTFDSAFVSGGYTVTPSKVGLSRKIDAVRFHGWKGGPISGVREAQWDGTNDKLIVTADGSEPFIRVETVTVTANAGRLSRVPGYIIAARASVGGTTGSLRIIPVGETPGTKQVAVNLATGALTFFATDAVTAAVFVYIPLGVGPFIEANRVVDESRTILAAGGNLANRAGLIQYVWNDTAGNLPTLVPVGEAPGSGAIAIDINNAGDTTITGNAAQDTNAGKVTYWKYSAFAPPGHFGWTDQGDITITSTSLFAFADDLAVPPNGAWVPGFGNVLIGETGAAANLQGILVDPDGAAAANVIVYDPTLGKIVPAAGDAYVTVEMPYVILNERNCPALGGALPAGFNLTSLVGRMEFLGR